MGFKYLLIAFCSKMQNENIAPTEHDIDKFLIENNSWQYRTKFIKFIFYFFEDWRELLT